MKITGLELVKMTVYGLFKIVSNFSRTEQENSASYMRRKKTEKRNPFEAKKNL